MRPRAVATTLDLGFRTPSKPQLNGPRAPYRRSAVVRGARQHVFHSPIDREIKKLSPNFDACLARFIAKNAPRLTPPRGLKMAPADSALTAVQAGVQSPSLVDEPGVSTGFARRIAKPFRSSGCKLRPTPFADFSRAPAGPRNARGNGPLDPTKRGSLTIVPMSLRNAFNCLRQKRRVVATPTFRPSQRMAGNQVAFAPGSPACRFIARRRAGSDDRR